MSPMMLLQKDILFPVQLRPVLVIRPAQILSAQIILLTTTISVGMSRLKSIITAMVIIL